MIKPERIRRLMRTAKQALRGQNGDVLEFGVALGGSAILLAREAQKHGCRFAGFDVFGMHPAPTDHDDAEAKARYEVIAAGQAKGIDGDIYYGYNTDLYQFVSGAFARHGLPVDGRDVLLVEGLFEKTWPSFPNQAIAFAHIDCSWHDPVKYSLEVVAPLLTRSGRIVVNTYIDSGGSRAAVDQFLASRPDFVAQIGETAILRLR